MSGKKNEITQATNKKAGVSYIIESKSFDNNNRPKEVQIQINDPPTSKASSVIKLNVAYSRTTYLNNYNFLYSMWKGSMDGPLYRQPCSLCLNLLPREDSFDAVEKLS